MIVDSFSQLTQMSHMVKVIVECANGMFTCRFPTWCSQTHSEYCDSSLFNIFSFSLPFIRSLFKRVIESIDSLFGWKISVYIKFAAPIWELMYRMTGSIDRGGTIQSIDRSIVTYRSLWYADRHEENNRCSPPRSASTFNWGKEETQPCERGILMQFE